MPGPLAMQLLRDGKGNTSKQIMNVVDWGTQTNEITERYRDMSRVIQICVSLYTFTDSIELNDVLSLGLHIQTEGYQLI